MVTTRSLIPVLLFALAAPAAAMPIQVIPSSPDSHDAVRVVTYPSCTAGAPHVARGDRQVTIEFLHMPGRGCIATWVPYPRVVELGALEGGEWEIVVADFAQGTTSVPLTVRGVDPFPVHPPGAPTTGARVRLGAGSFFRSSDTRVFFGDVEATGRTERGDYLFVDAPPHAAGIVDVTAITPEGTTIVARHAFKYYEPSATPDPFVFEPVLFPSAYRGPGAFGSEWRSEIVIAPTGWWWPWVHLFASPCEGCPRQIEAPTRIDVPSRPDGYVLWIGRAQPDDVALSSRLRDVSRLDQTAGTNVPVVRTRDFRQRIALPDVPNDGNDRVMLRVWSTVPLTSVHPLLRSGGEVREVGEVRLWPTPDGLDFGAIDLTPFVASMPDGGSSTVHLSAAHPGSIWAMVTITNNETQQVTVLTPN